MPQNWVVVDEPGVDTTSFMRLGRPLNMCARDTANMRDLRDAISSALQPPAAAASQHGPCMMQFGCMLS